MFPFAKVQTNCLDLFIWLQPNASRSQVTGVIDDRIKIKVQSPAVDGAANKALIRFISERLKVSKSCISIVAGEKSRKKTLRISVNSHKNTDFDPEKLIAKLLL